MSGPALGIWEVIVNSKIQSLESWSVKCNREPDANLTVPNLVELLTEVFTSISFRLSEPNVAQKLA